MAAPIGTRMLNLTTIFRLGPLRRIITTNSHGIRNARNSSSGNSTSSRPEIPTVVLSADGNTILCWHPEPDFPYEHTRPVPRNEQEMKQGESVLKVQYTFEEKDRYRPDGPTQRELMSIFHTTRHAFDHKPRMKYRKKNPPKDRAGL